MLQVLATAILRSCAGSHSRSLNGPGHARAIACTAERMAFQAHADILSALLLDD